MVLQVQNCFFWNIFVTISKKYCLFQHVGLGERCKLPQWVWGSAPEAKAFLGFT